MTIGHDVEFHGIGHQPTALIRDIAMLAVGGESPVGPNLDEAGQLPRNRQREGQTGNERTGIAVVMAAVNVQCLTYPALESSTGLSSTSRPFKE